MLGAECWVLGQESECPVMQQPRLTWNSAGAYDFCFPKSSPGIYVFSTFAEVTLGHAGNYGKEAAGDI